MMSFRKVFAFSTMIAVVAVGVAACHGLQIAYEDCIDSTDCEAGTQCLEVVRSTGARGNMCSNGCASDLDCFDGGRCLSVEGSPSICWQQCIDEFDCRNPFFTCAAAIGAGTNICFPE